MDVQRKVELRVTAGNKNAEVCFNIINLILCIPLKTVIARVCTKCHFCLGIFIYFSRLCLFNVWILSRVGKAPTDQTTRHALRRWLPGMKF